MSRRGWLALGVWLLITLACAWVLLAHTRVSMDLTSFLPRTADPASRLLTGQLREGPGSRLILLAISGGTVEQRAAASKALAAGLRGQREFSMLANGEDDLAPATRDFLFRNRYLLSPAIAPRHFDTAALRQALEARLDELSSPLGMLEKDLLPQDPTGEFTRILQVWSGQDTPAQRDGVWFSHDGREALLLVETRAPGFDIDAQAAALNRIHQRFARINPAGHLSLVASGPGVFSVAARAGIIKDVQRISVIDVVFLTGLLLLVFRSWRLLGLSFLPLMTGGLAGAAGVSLIFGQVHGITLGFGTTLIGIANDYPIHFFAHLRRHETARETLRSIWPTLLLGVLATAAGFGALLFSGFEGLAQIGVFTMIGLLAAGTVTRWILPDLVAPGSDLPAWVDRGRWSMTLFRPLHRLRHLPLFALVGALGFLLLTRQPLWNDDLESLSPVTASDKALDARLRAEMGAPELSQLLVIQAPTAEAALRQSEILEQKLAGLQRAGILDGYDMAAHYLPSQSLQRQRQALLPTPETLQSRLATAQRGLPFQTGLFAPFIKAVAVARTASLLTPASVAGTPLALRAGAMLYPQDGQWVALLPLRGVHDEAALAARVASWHQPGLLYLDLRKASNELVRTYREGLLRQALWGAIAIVLLLGVGLHSGRRLLRVLLPMAAAITATCATLVASGEGLTIFHLISLLLVAGVGMDYALFFNRERMDGHEWRRTLIAIIVCSLTTLVAFGALLLSQAAILRAIGMTVALGTTYAFLFAAMWARGPDRDQGALDTVSGEHHEAKGFE